MFDSSQPGTRSRHSGLDLSTSLRQRQPCGNLETKIKIRFNVSRRRTTVICDAERGLKAFYFPAIAGRQQRNERIDRWLAAKSKSVTNVQALSEMSSLHAAGWLPLPPPAPTPLFDASQPNRLQRSRRLCLPRPQACNITTCSLPVNKHPLPTVGTVSSATSKLARRQSLPERWKAPFPQSPPTPPLLEFTPAFDCFTDDMGEPAAAFFSPRPPPRPLQLKARCYAPNPSPARDPQNSDSCSYSTISKPVPAPVGALRRRRPQHVGVQVPTFNSNYYGDFKGLDGREWTGCVRALRDSHVRVVVRELRHIERLNHALDRATLRTDTLF